MQRKVTSTSVGLSASLMLHGLLALTSIVVYIRKVDEGGYYPSQPPPKWKSPAGAWVVERPPEPARVMPVLRPAELAKPPEPQKVDPRFARFGEPDGKGEALNSAEGVEPMRAREGPQDQALLSRDPEGPNKRTPMEPSMAIAVPSDGGGGTPGAPGRPEALRVHDRPEMKPRRPVDAEAAAPPLPPAPPPAAPPQGAPPVPAANPIDPLIAVRPDAARPRMVVATTQPLAPTTRPVLVQGPGDVPEPLPVPEKLPQPTTRPLPRTQIASTLPAAPNSTARKPLPDAAPTTHPITPTTPVVASATQPAPKYAAKPIESPRHDLTGRSDSERPARENAPTSRPVLAERPTTRPALAMAQPVVAEPTPALAEQEPQPPSPASAGGGGADGKAGRPGQKVVPADRAPMSESESDAFAKVASVDFKGGKVSARLGRKVRTVKPRLTLKGELDLFSIMQPSVIVKISIDETGKVTNVDNLKSSGSNEIDHPTILALYQWWIEPKKDKGGNPVSDVVVLKMTWH